MAAALQGVDHVIFVAALGRKLLLRTYAIRMKKSGTKVGSCSGKHSAAASGPSSQPDCTSLRLSTRYSLCGCDSWRVANCLFQCQRRGFHAGLYILFLKGRRLLRRSPEWSWRRWGLL
jgi:hypothetical protein